MDTSEKNGIIVFRIKNQKKKEWKNLCLKKQISLTGLIIDSVENRIFNEERNKVLTFIEKQDNVFAKIENNINQVARIANAKKLISEIEIKNFSDKLTEIVILKKQQNKMFEKIYAILAK